MISMPRTQRLAVLSLLLFTLSATESSAQFGGRGGMGGMGGPRGGSRDQSNSQDSRIRPPQQDNDSYEQIDYRLSLLEDDLHLQPSQRAPWESFASRVRAFATDIARARARGMTSSAGAGGSPGRGGILYIEQAADTARNRVTALEDIAVAAKGLYATLTPSQATLADMRMATIVAPQPRVDAQSGNANNLPDLGSSGRPPR
jgi:hypothetical protein